VRQLFNRRVALGWVAAVSLCGSALAGVNIPDWMRHAAAQPPGSYPSQTKAVVVLEETDFTVTAPGEYTEHHRSVTKILRPEGRDYGELFLQLEQKDKVNFIHAWSIDKSGHEYELKDKDFLQVSPFGEYGFLYQDIRARAGTAPASDPGTTVGFEYEVQRHTWINQINFFCQQEIPMRETNITLSLPAGWEYRDYWTGGTPATPAAVGGNRWSWTILEVPGIEREPKMPAVNALRGRVEFAYFFPGNSPKEQSWSAVGRWYAGLTEGRRNSTPEISQRVRELTAGKPDFDDKIRILTSFLQSEVRYVAISIGIGGNQPHPASDVFRYRYGDCKDKVTLLSSMLQESGIGSDYVLIDTDRGFVNPAVPSSWSDHAIIAIEVPEKVNPGRYQSVITGKSGKRYIIFDPTDEYTPVGSLRAELQNSYALLVTDNGGELIRTPLLPPEANQVTRTGYFVLTAEGGLSGDVSEDRSGDFAMHERGRLHYTDQRERNADFERWLGRSIQGFTLESMKIEQADQITRDLLINYKFTTPQYGQTRGPLMLVRSRVLDDKSSYVEHKPRRYPVELGQTAHETDTYEIQIPKEYRVDDIPDPVKIDVGFASYQSKIEVEGSKLRYWREYVVRDLSVPPEKFADWARLQGVIGADEAADVVLKKVQ
jgi:hypothetical protein